MISVRMLWWMIFPNLTDSSPVQSDSQSDPDSVTSFNVTCEAKVYPGWNILNVFVLNGHRVPFLRECLSISLSLSIFRTNSFPISVSASFFLLSFFTSFLARIVDLLNLWLRSERVIMLRPELIVEHFVTPRNHYQHPLFTVQGPRFTLPFLFYHGILFHLTLFIWNKLNSTIHLGRTTNQINASHRISEIYWTPNNEITPNL